MKILLKRNDQSGLAPGLNEVDLGELCINTADGKLFTKIYDGSAFQIIEVGGSGGSGELEKVTEDNDGITRTGWRLKGENTEYRAPIGEHALDFTGSFPYGGGEEGDRLVGASGAYSFVEGLNALSSGDVSHAEGCTKAFQD